MLTRHFKKVLSVLDNLFVIGGTFLINILLARLVSKQDYGYFVLSYSLFVFLQSLHNGFILEPFSIFGSGKYQQSFKEYFSFVFKSHIYACLLISLVISIVLAILWVSHPEWVTLSMLTMTCLIVFLFSGVLFRRALYLQYKVTSVVKLSGLFFLVLCIGIAGLYVLNFIRGYMMYALLSVAWLVAILKMAPVTQLIPGKQNFLKDHPHYLAEHWNYAKWVVATAFINQGTSQAYYWLVGGFLSATDLANFRAVQNIVLPVDLIGISLSMLVLPKLSEYYSTGNKNAFFSLLKKYSAAVITIALGYCGFMLLMGPWLLHLLYKGKYSSAGLLGILLIVPIVMSFGNVFNDSTKAAGRPKIVFYGYCASGIATFSIGLPLILRYGVIGAAYGLVISALFYSLTISISSTFSFKNSFRNAVA